MGFELVEEKSWVCWVLGREIDGGDFGFGEWMKGMEVEEEGRGGGREEDIDDDDDRLVSSSFFLYLVFLSVIRTKRRELVDEGNI